MNLAARRMAAPTLPMHILETIREWPLWPDGQISQQNVLQALAIAAAWHITETPDARAQLLATIELNNVISGMSREFNREKHPGGAQPPVQQ